MKLEGNDIFSKRKTQDRGPDRTGHETLKNAWDEKDLGVMALNLKRASELKFFEWFHWLTWVWC